MTNYFTADPHYGHENIIKYCRRPFLNIDDMNNRLMVNHNNRVKDGDNVIVAGDFCFRNSSGGKKGEGLLHKSDYYIKQLKGNLIFIKGNHDRNNSTKTIIERMIINYGGKKVCIVHNPEHADINYEINFVGHIHNNWKCKRVRRGETFTDLINIGVDVWDFKPVTFEEIMKRYIKWKRENDYV